MQNINDNSERIVLPIKEFDALSKSINDIVEGCKLLNENAVFFSIKDVMALTGWSKEKTQAVFNLSDFPSCDFGKKKIVLKTAFLNWMSKPRRRKELFPENKWYEAA